MNGSRGVWIAAALALGAGVAQAQVQLVDGKYSRNDVPEEYIVEPGDTLWDICETYFNEPYMWPNVWALNPQITNPHWIYPDDVIRLRSKTQREVAASDPIVYTVGTDNARQVSVNEGLITEKDLERAGVIEWSPETRKYLATGDTVYLKLEKLDEARVGEKFTVYRDLGPVTHPETGDKVGDKIHLLGVVEINLIDEHVARGTLTSSFQEIIRGDQVLPLQEHFNIVAPRQNLIDLKGTVVDALRKITELGEFHLVFLDRGAKDGVQIGNRFFVMRRGDGFIETTRSVDRRLPWEQIGEAIVVRAEDRNSAAVITKSAIEVRRGDRVVMERHY